MPDTDAGQAWISFGPFRLLPAARLVERDGAPVRMGGRAMDILICLVDHAGEVVSKRDLVARVWSDVTVDEGSLRFHIMALRKALGDGQAGARYVVNVPGRGYCLVAPVSRSGQSNGLGEPPSRVPRQGNLPAQPRKIVGRDETVRQIAEELSAYRFVTIVGAGGIGKTTVMLSVAHAVSRTFDGQVSFVGLGSLSEPDLVPAAVASTLGLMIGSREPIVGLAESLRDMRLLLILDNCEHVIQPVAVLAETLFNAAPSVHILATSRESLRVEGEHIHRLFPLRCPPMREELSAVDVLGFSAAQLFVERAAAASNGFEMTDAEARFVSDICHRLEGIPLALEIVAAWVDTFGIGELAARIDDRLLLTTQGRRTAVPRHRTLRAAIDWSYELLSEEDRTLLRHLAIFAGSFTLDAAIAVTANAKFTSDVIERLLGLVAKSLVAHAGGRGSANYRLLYTTRAYALERLAESGERDELARRLAEYCRGLLERAQTGWESHPGTELLSDCASQIDNVRAALDWAFSPTGDALLGLALATAAMPVLIHLSLLQECHDRAEQAIAVLAVNTSPDPRVEMKLQAALGTSRLAIGNTISQIEAPWTRTLYLAESLGDVDYQLRSLLGLWLLSDRDGLSISRHFFALAPTPADRLFGEFMIGASSHWRGDLITARHHLGRVIADDVGDHSGWCVIRFQGDQRLLSQAFMARTLWLQGFPEQATHVAKSVVAEAHAIDQAVLLCRTIVHAGCAVALFAGDLQLAERNIDLLLDVSTRHGLVLWRAFGNAYRGTLLIRRGSLREGLPLLRGAFNEFGSAFAGHRVLDFLGELARALGCAGQPSEGLVTIDDAINRSEQTAELWIMAELLRIKGELLAMHDGPGSIEKAEACFRQALDWAVTQKALSWELRAAVSLARLLRDHDRPADAVNCLQPIYHQFTEGFDTADLQVARILLGDLERSIRGPR